MSKKKKKLDKQLIAQRLRELEHETQNSKPKNQITPQKTASTAKDETNHSGKNDQEDNQADQAIGRDLKKVLILVATISAIFIALYFVNLKTDLMLNLSDKILKLLHVGIS